MWVSSKLGEVCVAADIVAFSLWKSAANQVMYCPSKMSQMIIWMRLSCLSL